MSDSATVVMTTVDSEELAKTLAVRLLEKRLAACVQELRINSHYRWDGELRYEPEILLLKGRNHLIPADAPGLGSGDEGVGPQPHFDLPAALLRGDQHD